MPSGIYQITNQVNGKRYIGSAVNLEKRWREHRNSLRRDQHKNQHLQRAFGKYGEDAFVFSILEYVEEPEHLVGREQEFLDRLKPEYNIAPIAGSCLGRPCSPETRMKLSKIFKGRSLSKETRSKLSEARMGKHHSEATRQKMSEAHKGKVFGEDHCRNISKAQKGRTFSEEHRRKLSKAKMGERNPNYGKHLSKEHRRKISEANSGERNHGYGKHPSIASRLKMSEAQKASWHRKHAINKKESGR